MDDKMPDTVTPAKDCPHYILTKDAEAGRTSCRGCEDRLDKVITNLMRKAEEILPGIWDREAA